MTYTLHHGDCLAVLPTLPDASVDAVICDPPYGTTACKWDSVIPFAPMWAEIKRVLKPRGACVLFGSQPFTSALVMSNPGWFKHEWIYRKNYGSNFLNAKREPMKEHESILVFSAGGWTYNPVMQARSEHIKANIGKRVKHTRPYSKDSTTRQSVGVLDRVLPEMRMPSSVQFFRVPRAKKEKTAHPTQKPLALLEYLVKTYTNPGDTVLDFAMGSGTTGHACINLDRHFIGIEREAEYIAIAQARLGHAAAQPRLALEDAA